MIPADDQPEATVYAPFPIQPSSSTQNPGDPGHTRELVNVPNRKAIFLKVNKMSQWHTRSVIQYHRTWSRKNLLFKQSCLIVYSGELQQLCFDFKCPKIHRKTRKSRGALPAQNKKCTKGSWYLPHLYTKLTAAGACRAPGAAWKHCHWQNTRLQMAQTPSQFQSK